MHDDTKFYLTKYINERADWSITRLIQALTSRGVSRADTQQLLRNFVDAQCSR